MRSTRRTPPCAQVARSVGTLDARVNTVWRRPCEFMPADAPINVFESDVQPSDISQGELGNCWFMCSLAALTEYPRLVDALFVDEWRRVRTQGAAKHAAALRRTPQRCDARRSAASELRAP
jgi:hypothetical protein